MMKKEEISDLTLPELIERLARIGVAPYRGGQILRWINRRKVDSFESMTDLSKAVRTSLEERFTIARLDVLSVETSRDGTRKFLFGLRDGNRIESVLIPERDHDTLCISSQVGCAQGCRFCFTAQGGLIRNLSKGEILAQVRDVQRSLETPRKLTNIVLMGMGEPLANYSNVVAACNELTDSAAGFGFAGKRITLSTAGFTPKLGELGRDTRVNLAVSLNAADNATRDRLMPINRRYPIEELLDACRSYPLRPHRRITFEYILLKGINDSEKDAFRLAKILSPIKAKINLIRFNSFAGCRYLPSDEKTMLRFQEILLQKNYTVIIRRSKGQDISAACGQLRGAFSEGV